MFYLRWFLSSRALSPTLPQRGLSSVQILILILAVQIVLAIIALGFNHWRLAQNAFTILSPTEADINHWRQITIRAGEQSPALILERENNSGRWHLPQWEGLLVDRANLHQTLQGLAIAPRLIDLGADSAIEERFATTPSLATSLWTLEDDRGQKINLLWGKRLAEQAFAIRRENSPHTLQWLMKSQSEADRFESRRNVARGWIEASQFAVPGGRAQITEIRHDGWLLQRREAMLATPSAQPSGALLRFNVAQYTWSLYNERGQLLSDKVSAKKIAAITEALGEMLIADVVSPQQTQILRQGKPLASLTFFYTLPRSTPSAGALTNDSMQERHYRFYAFGNELAIDFGKSVMVVPANADGEVLKNLNVNHLLASD